jgi:succinate---hydroxymethylglutarate CoA-transferase
MTDLPLTGVRILAFEQYGAGPFGTGYLADMGAEVIKVEPAGTDGDYARGLGPYFIEDEVDASVASLFFQAFNGNKKSLTLDITRPEGRQVLERLVASSDAVANNLRGDVPARLGLTYPQLKAANPAIVCAHCSAYGRDGSRADWPGYDFLMQAEAGYFHLCGEPGSEPTRMGLSLVDYMGGQSLALALVSAVLAAKTTGCGRDVDVNLYDTAMYNLSYLAAWSLNTDYAPVRVARSAHPSLAPCQLYKTADGWIYLMCNKQAFWPLLCNLIGQAELAADPRFAGFADRLANRDALTVCLDAALLRHTTAHWLRLFAGRIPAAPVLTPEQALTSDFSAERRIVVARKTASGKPFRTLRTPLDTGVSAVADPAPALGGHTREILRSVGYGDGEIDDLKDRGLV